jgi:hypothetical protein
MRTDSRFNDLPGPRPDLSAWLDDADRARGVLTTNRIAGHIVAWHAAQEARRRRGRQRHVDEEVGYSYGPAAELAQPGARSTRTQHGLPRRAVVDGTYMGLGRDGAGRRTNLEVESSRRAIAQAQAAHLQAVREAHGRILAAGLAPGERQRQLRELLRSGSVFAQVASRRPPQLGPGAVPVVALSRQGYRLGPGGTVVPVLRTLNVASRPSIDTLLRRGRLEYRRFDEDGLDELDVDPFATRAPRPACARCGH